jgi:hypothetical protein
MTAIVHADFEIQDPEHLHTRTVRRRIHLERRRMPRLRSMDAFEAHRVIATLHSCRFFGLVFILPGLVGPDLPSGFAAFAAYGDFATGVLAIMALLTVATRHGLRRFMVLFFIELSTRRVQIAGFSAVANGLWMNQIGRKLTDAVDGLLKGKHYLIHDRDPLFTAEFLSTLAETGTKSVKLPPRSPNLNSYAGHCSFCPMSPPDALYRRHRRAVPSLEATHLVARAPECRRRS